MIYAHADVMCVMEPEKKGKQFAIVIAAIAVAAVVMAAVLLLTDKPGGKEHVGNYIDYEVNTEGYSGTVYAVIVDEKRDRIKLNEVVVINQGDNLFYTHNITYWEPIGDGGPPGNFIGNETINNAVYGPQYTYVFGTDSMTYYIGADGVTYRIVMMLEDVELTLDLRDTNLRGPPS